MDDSWDRVGDDVLMGKLVIILNDLYALGWNDRDRQKTFDFPKIKAAKMVVEFVKSQSSSTRNAALDIAKKNWDGFMFERLGRE